MKPTHHGKTFLLSVCKSADNLTARKPPPLPTNAPAWQSIYMKDIEVYKPYPKLYDERVRSVRMVKATRSASCVVITDNRSSAER